MRKSPKRPHFCGDDGKNKHVKTKKKKNTAAVFVVSREKVMSGMRTRGQKRRIGERDVWDLIVNNDDICFKHILPRLNGTDIKFLYGVNSETRKLIKRSSRKEELKEEVYIERDVVDIDFGVCMGESIVLAELVGRRRNFFLLESC